jgi:hypothetical protein
MNVRILLRLDSIRNDGVGWQATFYGKPDIVGNSISVPASEDQARALTPGSQYLFESLARVAPEAIGSPLATS